MSATSDPALLTIAQALDEMRARRLSALELTEAVLNRIERLNPTLNAYLHVDHEGALNAARTPHPGPLSGIPICIKDLVDVAAMPTTAGGKDWRRDPHKDAASVAKLRNAGAIILGKAHTNEFAYGIDGRNEHWGNCRNPHDVTRICGGSSSGSAVATAAGLALAGLGTDTAGSIRAPASLCGLVGVRPTLGLVSRDGVVPLAWSYDAVGPLARTVKDAALVLDVLAGRQPTPLPPPPRLDGVRLGLLEDLIEAAEPYVESAIREMAASLQSLGAHVVSVRAGLLRHAGAIHQIVQHVEAAQAHRPWFDAQRERYSDAVRRRLEVGRLLPASAYLTAQQARTLLVGELTRAMGPLDALLAPSTPMVAPLQEVEEVTVRGARIPLRAALLSCLAPISQAGWPVVAVPVGRLLGLPFGVQIIGRPRSERGLLEIAAAWEHLFAIGPAAL